jgi:hypothetical protein
MRAERKAGQLLQQMEKAKGAPGNQHTGPLLRQEGTKTLSDLGISYRQSSDWQQLADVPEDEFEAVSPTRPASHRHIRRQYCPLAYSRLMGVGGHWGRPSKLPHRDRR